MTGAGEARGATFADAKRLTAHLRDVEESTCYGTPALRVRGRSFCRMWSQREYDRDGVHDTEVLVVFCDLEWKPALIEAQRACCSTHHTTRATAPC